MAVAIIKGTGIWILIMLAARLRGLLN